MVLSNSSTLATQREKTRKKAEVISLDEKGSITIKHKGALRAAAQRAGESTRQYAGEHKHDPGRKGREARLALTMMSWNKK